MRTKVIFALLLTIATLFSISFEISHNPRDGDKFDLPPTLHPPEPDYPGNSPADKQSECESDCERSGRWPLCGNDHCSYSGYKELECVHKCGRPVSKWTEGNCTKDTKTPPNRWIKVDGCIRM